MVASSSVAHPNDCLWIVKIQDQVIGTVGLRHEGPHVAKVSNFRIQPEWQRTSVLSRLIDRLHRYCWEQGYLKLLVDSRIARPIAQHFAQHRGFLAVRRKRVAANEYDEYLVDLYTPPRREKAAHNR
jgi:N-acetylglutamate synthase-like GNAT family acetyltransferase